MTRTARVKKFDDASPFWDDSAAGPGTGMQGRGAVLATLTGSVLIGLLLVLSSGNVLLVLAILAILTVGCLTVYRIEWGFYIFYGCVLLFDQFQIPGFEPLTWQIAYFENLKVIYLPGAEWAVLNPLELHMLFLLGVWGITLALRRDQELVPVPVWGAALLLFSWIGFSYVYGMQKGGNFLPALWEVRALFYFGVLYCFVPQVIRTRRQLATLLWITIACVSLKAVQGIDRFVELGFTFQGLPALTNHEDAAFFVLLLTLLIALWIFGGHRWQLRTLVLLSVPLVLGFIVSQRRAAFGSMGLALIALFVLFSWRERWKLAKVTIVPLLVLAVYLAAFWDHYDSAFAYPAQLVKASFSSEREETGDKYYSNLYRVYERYNLASTVQRAPIVGIGFGNTFDTPLKLAKIAFPLWDYIPHNEILWLLVKMGAIGFLAFWTFINCFLVRGASLHSRLKDPYLKALCTVSLVAVLNQMFVSYFDLQLTFHRNMVVLAVFMGLLPALEELDSRIAAGKS